MLILSDAYGLTAYDTKTGKLKWKTERKGNSSYNIEMMNGLLLASSTVSGAITTTQLHAISAYTGQIKWTYNGNFQDLLQTGPELHILRYNNGIDNGYALTIDVLEYSTGKMLNTLEYQPVPFVEMESAKRWRPRLIITLLRIRRTTGAAGGRTASGTELFIRCEDLPI